MTEYEIACLGKKRFPNRRTGGDTLRAYPCKFCTGAHIGHPPGHATYLRNGTPLQELTQ